MEVHSVSENPGSWILITKGYEDTFGVMDMLIFLNCSDGFITSSVALSQYLSNRTFKYVQFIVFQLYLNKTLK